MGRYKNKQTGEVCNIIQVTFDNLQKIKELLEPRISKDSARYIMKVNEIDRQIGKKTEYGTFNTIEIWLPENKDDEISENDRIIGYCDWLIVSQTNDLSKPDSIRSIYRKFVKNVPFGYFEEIEEGEEKTVNGSRRENVRRVGGSYIDKPAGRRKKIRREKDRDVNWEKD